MLNRKSKNINSQGPKSNTDFISSSSSLLSLVEKRMEDSDSLLLILLRGLPGSGKSKLASLLVSRYPTSTVVVNLDDSLGKWRRGASPYVDRARLIDAQAACKQAAWSAMRSSVKFVIIDQENLKYADTIPYISEAVKRNYEVHFLEPPNSWIYCPEILARKNRRGLTQTQLSQMLESFERYCSAANVVAELAYRQGSKSKCSKNLLTTVECVSLVNSMKAISAGSTERLNLDDPSSSHEPVDMTTNILESLTCNDEIVDPANTETELSDAVDMNVLDRLYEMFPDLDLEVLREIAEATDEDLEWAASLALETSMENASRPVVASKLAINFEDEKKPVVEFDTQKNQNSLVNSVSGVAPPREIFNINDFEANTCSSANILSIHGNQIENAPVLESPLSACIEDIQEETILTERDACTSLPSIKISKEFLESTFAKYGSEMCLQNVSLDFQQLPEEVCNDWFPEPELCKQILLSFLRQLGYFEQMPQSHKKPPSNTHKRNPRWKQQLSLATTSSAGIHGNTFSTGDINVPCLYKVMEEESIIRLSIEEQRKHFENSKTRAKLEKLIFQFPGTDEEVLMETLVRCGYDLGAAEACIVSGVLDIDSFTAASSTNDFEPSNQISFSSNKTRKPQSNTMNSLISTLQEVMDEDEAVKRSVADQTKKNQSLAVSLTLSRLSAQFPSFGKLYLTELLVKYDFDEAKTCEHLSSQGHTAQAVPPLIQFSDISSSPQLIEGDRDAYETAESSLVTLETEIVHLRESISTFQESRTQAYQSNAHPGVISFYSDELRKLRVRLNHRLSICRDLRVALKSQEYVAKNINQDRKNPRGATRLYFSFLDLHDLELKQAMIAFKHRLSLLESGCGSTSVSISGSSQQPLQYSLAWLPKRLTVVTGRGAHKQINETVTMNAGRPHSVIRNAVLNYLKAQKYDFEETPYLGCGCFVIRLASNNRKLAPQS